MYLPFLRGKQFELLALRELATLPLDGSKITPIIEPVKKDLKSVETAIKALFQANVSALLILNPENGELSKNYTPIIDLLNKLVAIGITNVIPTYIISNERDFRFFEKSASENGYFDSGYALIHLNQIGSSLSLKARINTTNLKINIIHVNHLLSLRRGYPKKTLALLSDPFVKQKRNVDYDSQDEFFSSDYFYYKDEGYIAFSDYLTIGSEYIEGGMLPYAVVIHLTYKDSESDDIRIKHFLSDSNTDMSDTPGKFGEALGKLIKFIDREDIHTVAADQFRDYHSRGAFPGLGVIKKLSIMHHIELIQNLI